VQGDGWRCKVEFGGGERRATRNAFRGMEHMVMERRRNVLLLTVRTPQEVGKSSPFLLPSTAGFEILCV